MSGNSLSCGDDDGQRCEELHGVRIDGSPYSERFKEPFSDPLYTLSFGKVLEELSMSLFPWLAE